jgi:hypothetical protein
MYLIELSQEGTNLHESSVVGKVRVVPRQVGQLQPVDLPSCSKASQSKKKLKKFKSFLNKMKISDSIENMLSKNENIF